MTRTLTHCTLVLLLTLTGAVRAQATSKVSAEAPALAALKQGQSLCYSADIYVNDHKDAALSTQAEATLLATLKGFSLTAMQYDAAKTCDREVYYAFSVDVDGAPTIYQAALSVRSYVANDGDLELPMAQIWRDGTYGGDSKVLSQDSYAKVASENLEQLLEELKTDYASLK